MKATIEYNADWQSLQIERLRPDQIEAALANHSLVYLPLGALEYHGKHCPIGLDSLTSHGICLRAAARTGGLVFPPLYYGMTATIAEHPWTFLAEESEALCSLLENHLRRLADCGVKTAVLFSGHFAQKQLELLEFMKSSTDNRERYPRVLALSISELPDSPLPPDHGGIFETSVLHALQPQLVDLKSLPAKTTETSGDSDGNPYGDQRRDPENELFGIFGRDPRDMNAEEAEALLQQLVQWLVTTVQSKS